MNLKDIWYTSSKIFILNNYVANYVAYISMLFAIYRINIHVYFILFFTSLIIVNYFLFTYILKISIFQRFLIELTKICKTKEHMA